MGGLLLAWVPQPITGAQVVQQPFFDSIFKFMHDDAQGRNICTGYSHASLGYIPASRNELMNQWMKNEAEWMLMLDWDISFTTEDVYTLLDAADPVEKPIIGGTYVTYMGGDNRLRPCWLALDDDAGPGYHPVNEFTMGGIYELATIGMGFTLIHRNVLEALAEDYKDSDWKWFGHDVINGTHVGEDLTFCTRARAAGFSSWGHGGVLVGHTKAKTLHPTDMANDALSHSVRPPEPVRTHARVLNVGGANKGIPLPSHFAGYEHVLLDIAKGPDVDVVADARHLSDLVMYSRTHMDTYPKLRKPFDAVFCSHTLEHFHSHEVPVVLAGCRTALKDGGTIEIHVPNIEQVYTELAEGSDLDDVAYEVPAGPILYRDIMFGWSKEIEESGQDHYVHKTAFTPARLTKVLEDAGFHNVEVSHDAYFNLAATAVK